MLTACTVATKQAVMTPWNDSVSEQAPTLSVSPLSVSNTPPTGGSTAAHSRPLLMSTVWLQAVKVSADILLLIMFRL